MPIKVGKLWKDVTFQSLSRLSKLLYLYLSTDPNINSVGVLTPNLSVVEIELGCTVEELRDSTKELVRSKHIFVKKFGGVIYFMVPEYFNTIPKATSSVLRVKKDLNKLPQGLVDYLLSKGISVEAKVNVFVKPSCEDISSYAFSRGYVVDGNKVIEFYEGNADSLGKSGVWIDGRGKEVRDWRAKLRRVWFKDENKLKKQEDAPKGFEFFHLSFDGVVVYPDGWRRGEPYSKDFAIDMKLKEEFKRLMNEKR